MVVPRTYPTQVFTRSLYVYYTYGRAVCTLLFNVLLRAYCMYCNDIHTQWYILYKVITTCWGRIFCFVVCLYTIQYISSGKILDPVSPCYTIYKYVVCVVLPFTTTPDGVQCIHHIRVQYLSIKFVRNVGINELWYWQHTYTTPVYSCCTSSACTQFV